MNWVNWTTWPAARGDRFRQLFIHNIGRFFLRPAIFFSRMRFVYVYMASLSYWVLLDSIAYCWINVFRIVHQVYIWHCLPSNWYGTVPRYERRNTGQNHYRAFPHFALFIRNRGVCLVSRKRNVYRFGIFASARCVRAHGVHPRFKIRMRSIGRP